MSNFPKTIRVRDTKWHDDLGGAGQRIYTTAGRGYEKQKYVRADCIEELEAENERIVAESKQCHETNDALVSEHIALKAENAKLRDAIRCVRCEFEDGSWQARKLDAAQALRLLSMDAAQDLRKETDDE